MFKNISHYPRAIVHVDGDCFFASCEVMQNPKLKGKPVVTGAERGIVSSLTYEAKARGVKRGMTLWEVKKVCPDVVVLPSDYETYSLMSVRMFEIVRRFTPQVEEYSIDECFADITGLQRPLNMSYEQIGRKIKETLDNELGITFSVGLAPTKVLAKIGSKWQKPSGYTPMPAHRLPEFLTQTSIDKIWGIGPRTSAYLQKFGVNTADDFASKSESWVRHHLSKPYFEIWQELQGHSVNPVGIGGKHEYQSISKTKTFTPPSNDRRQLIAQLSKNTENACIKLRRHRLAAKKIFFFIKTQDFHYRGLEIKLSRRTDLPNELINLIDERLDEVFNPYLTYRSTGVVVSDLSEQKNVQLDLFGQSVKAEQLTRLYGSIDHLDKKYGKHTAFLGSSFLAITGKQHEKARGEDTRRQKTLFQGETIRKRLGLPFMGEVA